MLAALADAVQAFALPLGSEVHTAARLLGLQFMGCMQHVVDKCPSEALGVCPGSVQAWHVWYQQSDADGSEALPSPLGPLPEHA